MAASTVDIDDAADWYKAWIVALSAAVLGLPSATRARRAALTVINSTAALAERGADADEAGRAAAVECATVVRRAVVLPAASSFARAVASSFARARDAAAAPQRGADAVSTAAAAAAPPPPPSAHAELPVGASTVTITFRDVVEATGAVTSVPTATTKFERATARRVADLMLRHSVSASCCTCLLSMQSGALVRAA